MARRGISEVLGRRRAEPGLSQTELAAAASEDGHALLAVQPVRLTQQGELIHLETLARGRPVQESGYHWRGELRLWDNEILMG